MDLYARLLLLSFSGLIFFLSSCTSAFYRREAVYKSDHLYLYTLSEKEYPEDEEIRKLLKPVQPFPAGSAEALLNLFTHIRAEKKGITGTSNYPVYYPAQLYAIAPIMKDVLSVAQPNVRYLLVTRYDPYQTIISKMKRNTLLFWYDGEKAHLVFGEVLIELVGDDFINDDKWMDIDPVNLKRAPEDVRLLDSQIYSFEKVGDFTHLTYITIPMSKLLALKPDPRFLKGEKAEKPATEKPDQEGEKRTVAERLKQLQKLKDSGTITEEEYEEQRKRILSEI